MTALAVALNGYLYAGNEDGNVYRSTDGGESWSETADLPQATYIHSLMGNWRGYIYAGAVAVTGDLYRSTDEGASWAVPFDIPENQVRTVGIAVDETLLAGTGTNGLLYRSVDSGNSWSALPAISGATVVYCAIPVFESVKYSWSGTPFLPGGDTANLLYRTVFIEDDAIDEGYLTALDFKYFKANGDELTPAEAATQNGRDEIVMVSIDMTLTLENKAVSKSTTVFLTNNRQ